MTKHQKNEIAAPEVLLDQHGDFLGSAREMALFADPANWREEWREGSNGSGLPVRHMVWTLAVDPVMLGKIGLEKLAQERASPSLQSEGVLKPGGGLPEVER